MQRKLIFLEQQFYFRKADNDEKKERPLRRDNNLNRYFKNFQNLVKYLQSCKAFILKHPLTATVCGT